MVRREPARIRVLRDIRDPIRAALADDQAEQPAAARQGADPRPVGLRDPARDEAIDGPEAIGDAERGVLGSDQVADTIDDQLEDRLQLQDGRDLAGRIDERLELADRQRCRSGLGRRRRGLGLHDGQSSSRDHRPGVGHTARALGAGSHYPRGMSRGDAVRMRMRPRGAPMKADPSIGMSPDVPPPPVQAGIRTILLASDLSPASTPPRPSPSSSPRSSARRSCWSTSSTRAGCGCPAAGIGSGSTRREPPASRPPRPWSTGVDARACRSGA